MHEKRCLQGFDVKNLKRENPNGRWGENMTVYIQEIG